MVLVVGASAERVLPLVSDSPVPDAVRLALYAYGSLYAVFALLHGRLRYRP